MLNSSNKSLIFNFDNITEKDHHKDCPYRKLVLLDQEKLIIYYV